MKTGLAKLHELSELRLRMPLQAFFIEATMPSGLSLWRTNMA
ncbi:hypothetical protein [Noviherbaspirillum sedimenti]|nr:hypothetical protein [Noviherbaspirillum sedimenti]